MNNYLIIIGGFIVGQFIQATVASWNVQKKHETLEYWEACKLYLMKGQAAFAVSIAALIGVLYIFPEVKDKGKILENLRWYSLLFGVFAQYITYVGFGVGKKIIDAKAKSEGVDATPE